MIHNPEEPAYPDLLAAAVAGYEEIRSLGDHAALVPDFVTLRTLASCGWIVQRTAAEDPQRRLHAERALAQARGVLGRAWDLLSRQTRTSCAVCSPTPKTRL